MKTVFALQLFREYQKSNLRHASIIGYRYLLDNFEEFFGDRDLRSISTEEIFQFLELVTEKSAKDVKVVFMPESVANRLKDYIEAAGLTEEDRIFAFSYGTARAIIKGLGLMAGVKLNPHDLRRHSATFASRNGVSLEIISKVILRHQNLKTTQVYLGKVSESEAIRWIDILHGK